MDDIDLAWAGGLFEGEGCITINDKGRGTPALRLKMTDPDIVLKFAETVGCGKTYGPYAQGTHKLQYLWQTTTWDDAQRAVVVMWPWLGQRRRARANEVFDMYARARVNRNRPHARYDLTRPFLSKEERRRINHADFYARHADDIKLAKRLRRAWERDGLLTRQECAALGRPYASVEKAKSMGVI